MSNNWFLQFNKESKYSAKTKQRDKNRILQLCLIVKIILEHGPFYFWYFYHSDLWKWKIVWDQLIFPLVKGTILNIVRISEKVQ